MKRINILILCLLLLAACGGEAEQPEETAVNTPSTTSEEAQVPEEPMAELPATTPTNLPPTATAVQAVTATPEEGITLQPTEELLAATEEPIPPTAAATDEPVQEPELTAAPVTTIQLATVATGLPFPLGMAHIGDNRMFIIGQRGVVQIMRNGQMLPAPFLDISTKVGGEREQGLLGMAFDPNYAANGRFYVHYSNLAGNTIIARYQVSAADPDAADPNSEEILLNVPQPYRNHNGGQIEFGPNGYLYIGLGDGGAQGDPENRAQDGQTLLGKILRIDVNTNSGYAIPASNPFVGNDAFADEIWSYGFRNPWRFSFDRATGDLYIADVGQNRWEEVSLQPANSAGGENYGWRSLEGNNCTRGNDCIFDGTVPAIAELNHQEGHCSITGGYVYRGEQFPELRGNYFFTDFCSGTIFSLFQNESGEWVKTAVYQGPNLISSFGEDANGELYIMTLERNGQLLQIQAP